MGLPIIVVAEAKQNNFTEGWGQCLAELVAAQKINQNKALPEHGIVTDGQLWQFGTLRAEIFTKNETVLAISDLKKIFDAINHLIKTSLKDIKG